MGHATSDATAAEPIGKTKRIMISSLTTLRTGHSPKLGGPKHDGIVKQTGLFQILD
jgi:hypothetical protein